MTLKKSSKFVLLLGAGLALPLAACAKSVNDPGSETSFAHFESSARVHLVETYRQLRESSNVDVCVGHVGYSHGSARGVQRTGWARSAVVAWISVVQQSPGWVSKAQKNYRIAPQDGQCAQSFVGGSAAFKINFYGTVQDQVKWTCGALNPVARSFQQVGLCGTASNYSSASPDDRTVVVSPKIGSQARPENFLFKTVLHEFGHVLGLADLYKGLGSNHAGGMTPSIMAYTANGLSGDDKLGIWNIEQATRTGVWDCGGHASARNLNPTNGKTYCKPSASSLANAAKAHAALDANLQRVSLRGKSVFVKILQDTVLKATDAGSDTQAPAYKCTVSASIELAATVEDVTASSDHFKVRFLEPVVGCPAAVALGGMLYAPHVEIKERTITPQAPALSAP